MSKWSYTLRNDCLFQTDDFLDGVYAIFCFKSVKRLLTLDNGYNVQTRPNNILTTFIKQNFWWTPAKQLSVCIETRKFSVIFHVTESASVIQKNSHNCSLHFDICLREYSGFHWTQNMNMYTPIIKNEKPFQGQPRKSGMNICYTKSCPSKFIENLFFF